MNADITVAYADNIRRWADGAWVTGAWTVSAFISDDNIADQWTFDTETDARDFAGKVAAKVGA